MTAPMSQATRDGLVLMVLFEAANEEGFYPLPTRDVALLANIAHPGANRAWVLPTLHRLAERGEIGRWRPPGGNGYYWWRTR